MGIVSYRRYPWKW